MKANSQTFLYTLANSLVKNGKRAKAYGFMHNSLWMLKAKSSNNPQALFELVFKKLKPRIKVVPFKRGSKARYLPLEISTQKQRAISVKWLLTSVGSGISGISWKLASIVSKTARDKGAARDKKASYYKLGWQNKRTLRSLRVRRFKKFKPRRPIVRFK